MRKVIMPNKERNTPITLEESMISAKVTSVKWGRSGKHGKTLCLQLNGASKTNLTLMVPRSACVTEGDTVYIAQNLLNGENSLAAQKIVLEGHNGLVQISPIYSVNVNLQIGSTVLPIQIKEISQQDEFDGYVALSRYHYRDKTLFGRHSPLVAVSNHLLLPKVIGYIDLTTAFFVNTPRRRIMDEPTKLNGLAWEGWTKEVVRKHLPLFVRIARCVVHPELRAMGLGKILIDSAADFARSHWQSAYWKPYFLEISADMLRYIPFVEKAGMVFVGETEGNLDRIAKDLQYLKTNEQRLQKEIFKGDVFGILDTKLSQLQKANAALNGSRRKNLGAFITKQIQRPTLDGWASLAGVLSLPKPHYMMGLNSEAMQLVTQRSKSKNGSDSLAVKSQEFIDEIYKTRLLKKIELCNLSYQVDFSVKRTKITHAIERSFEISLDSLSQPVIRNLSLDILPGETVVITGLSGTGKTTLMKLLARMIKPTGGNLLIPAKAKIGMLSELPTSKSLVEVVGQGDAGKGIYWLGMVGLSEPFLLVKNFSALSAGQKYRAMLAMLLTKGSNVWLIDEFCENLDLINTHLLAQKLSNLAKKVGATVVVASSDAKRFAKSLNPDKVLVLKGATDTDSFKILPGKKFVSSIEKT